MANEHAIALLQKERIALLSQKEQFLSEIDAQINDIENSIENLSGKSVWETEPKSMFDDENPNYIRSSHEE